MRKKAATTTTLIPVTMFVELGSASGGSNRCRRNEYPDLAPQQLQEHGNTSFIANTFEYTDSIGKNIVNQADGAAGTHPVGKTKPHETGLVLTCPNLIHYPVRYRDGRLTRSNKLTDANCRMHREPAIELKIERDK